MDNSSYHDSKQLNHGHASNHVSVSLRVQYLAAALLLFLVLYTLTNKYSSAAFEHASTRIHNLAVIGDNYISFIPAMIVPYSWSMILFIASFFMVRTSHQLSLLTSRLILATLLASIVFYLYPAHFSFDRPLTTDWTAFGYAFLEVTDKPYNQFPSLHVSYAVLLGTSLWHIKEDTHQWQRMSYQLVLIVVCILIIFSTVLTYQHHLLDIAGGFVLAGLVLLIDQKLYSMLVLKHLAIGISGALLFSIAGFFVYITFEHVLFEYIGWAVALYWLASFVQLAWLYQTPSIVRNKRWFRKNRVGKLTVATWLRFAPILLVYRIMSFIGQIYFNYKFSTIKPRRVLSKITYYVVTDTVSTVATPRLSSPILVNNEGNQVQHLIVVDVAAEIDSHYKVVCDYLNNKEKSNNLLINYQKSTTHYLYLSLLDLQSFSASDVSMFIRLFKALDALLHQNAQIKSNEASSITLINFHCVMGLSRSVAMHVLYLVYCNKITIDTYQSWINTYYPRSHLTRTYLPESLIAAISKHAQVKTVKS